MTDVSKQLRAKLAEVAEIVLPEIVTVQTSSDGTEKLLLRLRDGALVETVILPSTGQDGFRPHRPVRVFANRLRDGLHVLQHGHDGLYPQHDRRGKS